MFTTNQSKSKSGFRPTSLATHTLSFEDEDYLVAPRCRCQAQKTFPKITECNETGIIIAGSTGKAISSGGTYKNTSQKRDTICCVTSNYDWDREGKGGGADRNREVHR